MDWSLPGCSIHGVLQARVLEWLLFPSPRILNRSKNKFRKQSEKDPLSMKPRASSPCWQAWSSSQDDLLLWPGWELLRPPSTFPPLPTDTCHHRHSENASRRAFNKRSDQRETTASVWSARAAALTRSVLPLDCRHLHHSRPQAERGAPPASGRRFCSSAHFPAPAPGSEQTTDLSVAKK